MNKRLKSGEINKSVKKGIGDNMFIKIIKRGISPYRKKAEAIRSRKRSKSA